MTFLNPYLLEDEVDFFQTVKTFATEKVFPSVEQRDANSEWSDAIWKEMGAMGLNGIAVPEAYGGQGASCIQCCQASEAFNAGSADGGLGLAWGAHTIIGTLPIRTKPEFRGPSNDSLGTFMSMNDNSDVVEVL